MANKARRTTTREDLVAPCIKTKKIFYTRGEVICIVTKGQSSKTIKKRKSAVNGDCDTLSKDK